MQVKKKLGELLIENGLITETQLEEVLRSKKSSQRLGQALINLNLVTQQDIINVLEFQFPIYS